MSTKKNIIRKSGTIALATVLVGSSLLSTLPINVFANETALKNAIATAAPIHATEVATFEEFKAALLNTSVTDIKLIADFKVTTSFNFTTQKNLYGNGHTIDMNFAKIGIAKANSVNRVEDLTITNQNIYPLFWSEHTGVQVTYKDVDSSGKQFVYNANGTTILEGNIKASADYEEVYQGTALVIKNGSNVNFSSTSVCPAIRLYGSLTQEANADLKVHAKDIAVYGHNGNTQISVAGNMDLTSTSRQAIYTAWSGGNMLVKTGAKFKATAGDLVEEGISLTSGNLTVQSGADFVANSVGKQGTVQTGGKLVFENGSNFAITNTNAIGSVFANYAGNETKIDIKSDKGLSTWDSGFTSNPLPTHNYNDFSTATFNLSGWAKDNLSQKQLTSNSAQFHSQFVSKTTAKLFGGSYALTNIAQTTIDELTTTATQATGVAEPNATVVITNAAGVILGTGKVGSDGYYSVIVPKQTAGTKVTATATSNGIKSSATTTVIQVAIAQTTIASLTTDSTTATGTAEPNATIEIKANGEVIGSGKVGSDGSYSIMIPQQDVGTRVTATAKLGEATSSATTTVTQGDLAQTTIAALTTKSTIAEGTAQPNATISIKNSAGDILGSGRVGSDGKYSIMIPKQAAGTIVTATAVSNGKTSTAQTTVVRGEIDDTTINKVTTESTIATGTAEPNSTVVISDQDGKQLATGRVGSDGIYSLMIAKQAEGTVLTATASLAGFTATASTIVVRDGIDQTTINTLTTDSTSVSGLAEPNATIVVKDQTGKQLASGRVGSDGIYSMTIAKQAEGTVVTATATLNGKTSTANTTVVRDGIDATIIDALTADSTTVTGTAEANATIVIKNAAGTTIGSGTVGSDGKYSITIPKQAEGTVVTATASKSGKTESASTTVKAGQAIAQTTINNITTDQTSVTGKGEPGGTIVIKNGNTQLASGTVAANGTYTITIPKQAYGTTVTATVTSNGKTSAANTVVTQGAIAQTTINNITTDQTSVTGKGEPGGAIVIKNGNTQLASGTVPANGQYSFVIPKQAANSTVVATVIKNDQMSSASTKVVAIPQSGSLTATDFTVGTDKNITGTYTGDVKKLRVTVGTTVYTGGTVNPDGTYKFYAADKIGATTTATTYKIEALDKNGNVLDTKTANIIQKDNGNNTPGVGTLTATDFTVGTDKNITGTYTGEVKKLRVTVGTEVYTGGAVNPDGTYKFYAADKIGATTTATTYKIEALDKNGNVVSTKTAKIIKNGSGSTTPGTGTLTVNDYVINTDKKVTGTLTGAIKTIKLVYDGVTYSGGTISGNEFSFYAFDKIVDQTKSARIDGYDANGNKIATSAISLSDSKNSGSTIGTGKVTANSYKIGADKKITGTYTGDVVSIKVRVGSTTYSGGTLVDGGYSFYAHDKISSTDQVVYVDGYDRNGNKVATSIVSISKVLPATKGTIKPNTFKVPGDTKLTATYTGDVNSVVVTINGTKHRGGTVSNGNVSFYIGNKIASTSDVVTIEALDVEGKVLDAKSVTITN